MLKFRRMVISGIAMLAIVSVLAVTLVFSPSSPSKATSTLATGVYVTVICPVNKNPVGLWYHAQYSGQQGWARWVGTTTNAVQQFSFGLYSIPDNVYITMGCGGTTSNWGTIYTGGLGVFKSPTQNFTAYCYRPQPGNVCPISTY